MIQMIFKNSLHERDRPVEHSSLPPPSPFFSFPGDASKIIEAYRAYRSADAGTGLTQFIATKISCVAISSRRLTGSRRDTKIRGRAAALIGD